MKEVILIEASSSTKNQKKYKCPYCDQRFIRSKLHIHIQDKHEDLIPEGYTALRIAFNTINHKDHGTCIICKEEAPWNEIKEAPWNEIKGRYERLCGKESCKEAYKKMVAERNKRIYGTDRLQTDPKYNAEVQKKALAGRKIAGKYKFDDGGEIAYVGSYEKKLLEFLDKTMKCNSEDILSPGPEIPYIWNDQEHVYLPDFYYIPYNLIIEVKDGGDNKNNNPGVKEDNGSRLQAKEKAVKDLNKYSYIRLTNNNFGQLLSLMALLKYNLLENNTSPVYRINESSLINEGYIFSKDNLFINFDKFKDGKTNICFVTGLSGSGKSTEAEKLAKEYNAEWIELDIFEHCKEFSDGELKQAGQVFYDYLSNHKDIWNKLKNNELHGNDLNNEIAKFIKYCIRWCLKHKEDKWIIEGVQVFSFIDPKEIKSYPIVFIRASMLKSILQRWKRNGDGKIKLWKELKNEFPQLLSWYIDNEKAFKAFQKAVLNESSEFKSNSRSNIVITDNLEIANALNLRYPNGILITANDFEDLWKYDLNRLSNNDKINTNKSFYDYIISNPELKQAFDNNTISKDLLIKYTSSYLNYLLYWCMKYKDNIFIIYSKYMQSMVDEYTLRNIKIYNESTSEAGMSGTIGAALPLAPSPTPYESDKDNYYIVNNLGNNAFAGDYSITKDPIEYNTYSFDVENGYKVFKSKKIDKKSLVFKLKDKQSAKELYEEIENLYNNGLSIPYPEYLYERYTGKLLLDPTQLLNEDSLELVYNNDIQDICESIINYIYPKNIDILEEQVNDLIFRINTSIHEYGIEDEYNVLPDDVATLDELEAWKDRYNFMTYDQKRHSNELSIQLYGQDNITRYGIIRHKFLSEDPGNDDHMKNIGNSIGIDPIIDDIF